MVGRDLVPLLTIAMAVGFGLANVSAQTPAPPAPPPKKAPPPATTRPAQDPENIPVAPQVVTVVHRMNGLKMFRLLLREEQVGAISDLDSAFSLMEDVHTNVIAGLAMDDGKTIAAWLPDAEVEFGLPPSSSPIPRTPLSAGTAPTVQDLANPVFGSTSPRPWLRGSLFEAPDLTVIGSDGRRLPAEFVGLDGVTGLSILKLADQSFNFKGATKEDPIDVGENVRLFGPEPVNQMPAVGSSALFVRIGAIQGRIQTVTNGPSGGVARFKVRAPRLSAKNIGGVALSEAGETLGIVDAIEGTEASILPTALIQRAAKRVLERKSSVPRPWLGVRGEPVAALNVEQFLKHGWKLERATAVAGEHRGILLTSVLAGSPAAQAALRAGDVILKVNNEEILNADDFTFLLEQAGPSSQVSFTLARPDRASEDAVNIRLSALLNPRLSFNLTPLKIASGFSLIDQGIETIEIKPAVASRLGASGGLLVVYVQPFSRAFEAGLRAGDVIESIDNKPVPMRSEAKPVIGSGSRSFEVVRKKKKFVVTVDNQEKKK